MFLNPELSAALDRIAERAADVRRAYTPGALPVHDDVATASPAADFTLDPLSVAPPDDAYFVRRSERGNDAYTRDGSFTLRDGLLTGADGVPVLGRRAKGGDLGELRVDPVDERLARVSGVAISGDGTFSYARAAIDPRTGVRETQRVTVGRLALARFPAGTRLTTSEGAGYAAPSGVTPEIGFAGEGDFGAVTPLRRERSRIDVDASLVRLKEAYLAFDALQAAHAAKAHLGKTAMELLK